MRCYFLAGGGGGGGAGFWEDVGVLTLLFTPLCPLVRGGGGLDAFLLIVFVRIQFHKFYQADILPIDKNTVYSF